MAQHHLLCIFRISQQLNGSHRRHWWIHPKAPSTTFNSICLELTIVLGCKRSGKISSLWKVTWVLEPHAQRAIVVFQYNPSSNFPWMMIIMFPLKSYPKQLFADKALTYQPITKRPSYLFYTGKRWTSSMLFAVYKVEHAEKRHAQKHMSSMNNNWNMHKERNTCLNNIPKVLISSFLSFFFSFLH